MSFCTKAGCRQQSFLDTARCFDHQPGRIDGGIALALTALWVAFCAVVTLGFLAVVVWAIIQLVTWVTAG